MRGDCASWLLCYGMIRINISKDSRGVVADFLDLPGSPYVGIGRTDAEAVGELILLTLGGVHGNNSNGPEVCITHQLGADRFTTYLGRLPSV